MQLITYADRLADDLKGLRSLMENEFGGLFDGVHVLPFFAPIDGADAGFDPIDHTSVDKRVGDWGDISSLSESYSVMADLIVNHVSADSEQFQDVLKNGRASPYWKLFLKMHEVFSEEQPNAIEAIYRPRQGDPFTTFSLDDGEAVEFWTTFSPNQIDINVEEESGQAYLEAILHTFAEAGVKQLRLDAAGYAIKRAGTSCFMLPETFEFVGKLSRKARDLGMEALVEVHSHYQTQIAIASQVGRVYDFALPPLILHALYTGDTEPCKRWLEVAPRNCVTVLDTHDGIGIVDVGGEGHLPGLLTDEQLEELVETIHLKTGGVSRRASGYSASNLDVYQVNSTYYEALGCDDNDYLIARAIQFFVPGTPQIYYVGLLAGRNDIALVEKTGVGRDVNRHYYTLDEIHSALRRPVVKRLFDLIRLRNNAAAFAGEFSLKECERGRLILRWEAGREYAQLDVDFKLRRATVVCTVNGTIQQFDFDSAQVA